MSRDKSKVSVNLVVPSGLIVLSDHYHNQTSKGEWFGYRYNKWGFYVYQYAHMPPQGGNPAGICLASFRALKEFDLPPGGVSNSPF